MTEQPTPQHAAEGSDPYVDPDSTDPRTELARSDSPMAQDSVTDGPAMNNPARVSGTVEPGWYPDPSGSAPLRWWDGSGWARATHVPTAAPTAGWRTAPPVGVEQLSAVPPGPQAAAPVALSSGHDGFPEFLAPEASPWSGPEPGSTDPTPYPDLFDGPAQSEEQRRRSRRGLWLALGGVGVIIAIAVAAIAILLAAARTSTLDTAAIETDIAGRLSEEAGGAVTVICPDSVTLSAGSTFNCDATGDDGSHVTVVVRQSDGQGNVTWRIGS